MLGMIQEEHDYNTIRKTLGVSAFRLALIYRKFRKDGLIKDGKITSKGTTQIAKQDVSRVQVLYSYAKNPSIEGADLLPTHMKNTTL